VSGERLPKRENAMTRSASSWRLAISIFAITSIAGCTSTAGRGDQPFEPGAGAPTTPTPSPSPAASTVGASSTSVPSLADFSFPTEVDPTRRYMFYLHGKIIEDQGIPAISPEYGEYRYEDILRTLQSYGFVVISEQRPTDADPTEYAERVAMQVDDLLSSGVAPGSITVVGASKGAAIAMIASYLLSNSEVNYVILGGCNPPAVDQLRQQGILLFGNVLAIYDSSDAYAGSCAEFFALSEANGPGQHRELVVHVGTGHGILYDALAVWVLPTVQWANQEW
jgi:hypothetical protein